MSETVGWDRHRAAEELHRGLAAGARKKEKQGPPGAADRDLGGATRSFGGAKRAFDFL